MGHRLSKIYTRTGDDGTTGLADGSRVAKDSLRMECMGTVDELNAALGVTLAYPLPPAVHEALSPVQHALFDLGGELALPSHPALDAAAVAELEAQLDKLNAPLPPLKEFILPGGNVATGHCHLARAICRRAERQLVALRREAPDLNPFAQQYLNRLSDLLFVAARVIARADGGAEVYWQPRHARS